MQEKHKKVLCKFFLVIRVFIGNLIILALFAIAFPYEVVVNPIVNSWLEDNEINARVEVSKLRLLSGIELNKLYIGKIPGYTKPILSVDHVLLEYTPLSYVLDDEIWVDRILLTNIDATYETKKKAPDNITAFLELIIGKFIDEPEMALATQEGENLEKTQEKPENLSKQYTEELKKALKELVISISKLPIVTRSIVVKDIDASVLLDGDTIEAENLSLAASNVATINTKIDGAAKITLEKADVNVDKSKILAKDLIVKFRNFQANQYSIKGETDILLDRLNVDVENTKLTVDKLKTTTSGRANKRGTSHAKSTLSISKFAAFVGKDYYRINGTYLKVSGSYGDKTNAVVEFALQKPGDYEVYGKQGEDNFKVEIPIILSVESTDLNNFKIYLKAPVEKVDGSGIFGKLNNNKLHLLSSGYFNIAKDMLYMKPLRLDMNDKNVVKGFLKVTKITKNPYTEILLEDLKVMNLGPYSPLAMMTFPALKITGGMKIEKDNFLLNIKP